MGGQGCIAGNTNEIHPLLYFLHDPRHVAFVFRFPEHLDKLGEVGEETTFSQKTKRCFADTGNQSTP